MDKSLEKWIYKKKSLIQRVDNVYNIILYDVIYTARMLTGIINMMYRRKY
jgi:hypothetical protein